MMGTKHTNTPIFLRYYIFLFKSFRGCRDMRLACDYPLRIIDPPFFHYIDEHIIYCIYSYYSIINKYLNIYVCI